MTTSTHKEKRATPVARRARPSGQAIGPAQRSQRKEIHNILNGVHIQPKLTVGASNDKYEQEADRVADEVMRMPDPQGYAGLSGSSQSPPPHIQRMCPECEKEQALQRQPEEEEEELQAKLADERIQRQAEDEEDETLQAKESAGQTPQVSSGIESRINSLKGGGQPLDPATRSFFEPRFGHDFSHVRVHADGSAAETANSVNAKAFTLGSNVVFGSGEYQPGSDQGRRLLSHELTHVVQQKNRVSQASLQRTCSPARSRDNSKPDEGIKAGQYQDPADACSWIFYGFHIGSKEYTLAFSPGTNLLNQYLKSHTGSSMEIQGFADCFGSDSGNIYVANKRAANMKQAFTSGVQGQITVLPNKGPSYITGNDTALRRAINRGVRVKLIPTAGDSCPASRSLLDQLSPKNMGMCSTADFEVLKKANAVAVATTMTALARIRDWKKGSNIKALLDAYFASSNDVERQEAATVVETFANKLIGKLQTPTFDCIDAAHFLHSIACKDGAGNPTYAWDRGIGDAPTFCFPEMNSLADPFAQSSVIVHEFSHRLGGTHDYGAYYDSTTCLPTTSVASLGFKKRLTHTDTVACFITILAQKSP